MVMITHKNTLLISIPRNLCLLTLSAKFNKYVTSTRIRAARNIAGFALPISATVQERWVEMVLKQACWSSR